MLELDQIIESLVRDLDCWLIVRYVGKCCYCSMYVMGIFEGLS